MNGMQYLKNKKHLDELPFKRIFVVGSFKRFGKISVHTVFKLILRKCSNF